MRPMKCESLMDREGTIHLDKIIFPKLWSVKLDGNRCYIEDGVAKSSSGKPIRNKWIREILSDERYNGLDGEICVGPPNAKDVRRKTSSGVSSYEGQPDFGFYVFDMWSLGKAPFEHRLNVAQVRCGLGEPLSSVHHSFVSSIDELLEREKEALEMGYEGLILRDPTAPYKHGRSTLIQNWALKLKRFKTGEARIIGFEELLHNDNEPTLDEHGYTERSHHKDGRRGGGVLGAFVCRDIKTREEFSVGTGFSAEDRARFWACRPALLHRIITYKHFPVGRKDKPNLPSFIDIRDPEDITPDPEENPFQ